MNANGNEETDPFPIAVSDLNFFEQLKTNSEKVMFASTVIEQQHGHPDTKKSQTIKNNAIACKIRQKGNAMFALQEQHYFIKALELYNESICMAVKDSEDFSIAIANRSAVYLDLGKPELCLKDIQLARNSGYPLKLLDKLNQREKVCVEMMKKKKPKKFEFKLPGEFQKPHFESYLERKENKEFGRYVVTNQLVNPGDIMIVEDAFSCVPYKDFRFKRCWHCTAENDMRLIPCHNCTQVMYCSKECLEASQLTYHPYECPIIDSLVTLLQELELVVLHVIIRGVLAFGSLTNIGDFLDKHGKTKVDALSKVDVEGLYKNEDQKKFHQIYSLNTLQAKRSTLELFRYATVSGYLLRVLSIGKLEREICSPAGGAIFSELLFHFLQSGASNCQLHEMPFQNRYYGKGFYPIASLLNHSCAPNVMRFVHKSQQAVVALRVIRPGEQLFDSYRGRHSVHPKKARQENLYEQYFFHCRCIACSRDYPTFNMMRTAKIPEFSTFNLGNDRKTKLIAYLKKHDRHYPCSQIWAAQSTLMMELHYEFGNASIDTPFKHTTDWEMNLENDFFETMADLNI